MTNLSAATALLRIRTFEANLRNLANLELGPATVGDTLVER